jgi:hypothetical protein
MTFMVFNSYFTDRAMQVLADCGIDYYTRWDNAKGKGQGTEPHLGTGAYGSTNTVLMIAFKDEAVLENLVRGIEGLNRGITRPADHFRLFQMPLDRIV